MQTRSFPALPAPSPPRPASGWFCGAAPLVNKLRLRVRNRPGEGWREVAVPRSVRALVLLNLQASERLRLEHIPLFPFRQLYSI